MSMSYFIAGSVFLALTLIVAIVKKRNKRNKEYDKAVKDIDKAIDNHDWDALDDAHFRMWKNR